MKRIVSYLLILISIGLKGQISIFNIDATDIVYEPNNSLLYATVSGSDINYGNNLIAMNPVSGTVLKQVYIGSEPLRIKLTSDHKYAYISFSGIGYIKRINLSTFTVDREILLGPLYNSATEYAYDFEVIPNSVNKVAVIRMGYLAGHSTFDNLVLYNDGILQPYKINNDSIGSNYNVAQIIAKSDGKTLFGYNSFNDQFDCYYFSITDSGFVLQNHLLKNDLLNTFAKIKSINDTVYAYNGRVSDVFSIPSKILGTCPSQWSWKTDGYGFTSSDYYNSFVFSKYGNFNGIDPTPLYLDFYKKSDFTLSKEYYVPLPKQLLTAESYYVNNLIDIGNGRFAFILTGYNKYKGIVYLDPKSSVNYIDPTLIRSGKNRGISYSTFKVRALDQAYNWKDERLYTVISGKDSLYPNCILKINPITNEIVDSLTIGEEPYKIKLTTDLDYAYIAFRKKNVIKRVNLKSFVIDQEIKLNSDTYPTLYALDFEIIPNSDDKIAVSRTSTFEYDSFVDLVLYNGANIAPKIITPLASLNQVAQIVAKSDGKYLFGFNSISTSFDCYLIRVSDSGLETINSYENLIQNGFNSTYFPKIKVFNDEVVGGTGTIVDAFSEIPKIKGTCLAAYYNCWYGYTFNEYLNAYIFPSNYTGSLYLHFYNKGYSYMGSIYVGNVGDHCYVESLEVLNKSHLSLILSKSYRYLSYEDGQEYMINVNLDSLATAIPGINYSTTHEELNIYPNPAKDIINIRSDIDIIDIKVLSIDGMVKFNLPGKDCSQLDVNFLKNGIYIIKFQLKNGTVISKKMIKI